MYFTMKDVLANPAIFTQNQMCWSIFLIKLHVLTQQLYLKKTPTQLFSYEICEIFKNNYFYYSPQVAAS